MFKIKDWSDTLIKTIDVSFFIISIIAISSLIIQYGFFITPQLDHLLDRLDILIVFYFVLQYFLRILLVQNKIAYIKHHWFETLLIVLIILETAVIVNTLGINLIEEYFYNINVIAITKVTIVWVQIIIILSIISRSVRYNIKIASLKFHPAQTFLLSFIIVIVIGGSFLMLPRATVSGEPLTFINAFFTSASATCVTGLVIVDTGSHFSFFGQMIILTLVQIGGLGIMTFSSFLAMLFGGGMAIKERVMLQEMMNIDRLSIITQTLRNIVLITFFFELIGSIVLYCNWNHPEWTIQERIFQSIFHSISAFCNAGFSLNADSFMSYSHNYWILITIALLIIIGGLGFVVIIELGGRRILKIPGKRKLNKMSIQTKLVLIITAILLTGGTLAIFLLGSFEGSLGYRLMQSFFSSVTARTAGFNTIDFSLLSVPVALLIMMLMFIGASPGSTGGGVKTTTIGILFGSLFSIISGSNRIKMFRKNISFTILNRALVIFAFSIIMITVSTFLLSITEQANLIDILFEEFSAYGTVGLSRGLTASLSDWGKIIIIISMFIGRVGALTLAFSITTPKERRRVEYPTEKNIMVG